MASFRRMRGSIFHTGFVLFQLPPPSLSKSPPADTEGCEHTWRKFHGHCYRYFSRRHTWEDAEKDCREHSGHLASIHSAAEQNFIRGGTTSNCVVMIAHENGKWNDVPCNYNLPYVCKKGTVALTGSPSSISHHPPARY
uniref:C-type lectin domain-containing protein n=1 Tax=Amphiprion percula TaxID=161767 RepID=A0A3P8SJ21_AMPPE